MAVGLVLGVVAGGAFCVFSSVVAVVLSSGTLSRVLCCRVDMESAVSRMVACVSVVGIETVDKLADMNSMDYETPGIACVMVYKFVWHSSGSLEVVNWGCDRDTDMAKIVVVVVVVGTDLGG
jgi:hypothetical protein